MNRRELIREVRYRTPVKRTATKELPLTLDDIDRVLRIICDTIIDLVAVGEEVAIDEFGKFYPYKTKDRVGTNPKTHEKIQIDSRTVPKFQPYKLFRDEVNS